MNSDLKMKLEIVDWSWKRKKVDLTISKYKKDTNLKVKIKNCGWRCL